MKTKNWFKAENYSGNLSVTATGGSATAFVLDNIITVDFTNTSTTASYVVETPFGFKVVDVDSVANGTATGATVYVDNGATHISSNVGAATDTTVKRTVTIVDSSQEFANGDDDLTISASATSTAACAKQKIRIHIEPV